MNDLAAGYGGVMVSLGDRLGLYRAMDGAGPLTSAEVAERAGCAERYVREWLNSQVAAGYLSTTREPRTYELPPEHAVVLADPDSPILLTPAFNIPASMWHGRGAGHPTRSAPATACRGARTTSACSAASARSTATPTAAASCRSGCPRSTAWSSGSRRARRSPTSAAAMGTRRS